MKKGTRQARIHTLCECKYHMTDAFALLRIPLTLLTPSRAAKCSSRRIQGGKNKKTARLVLFELGSWETDTDTDTDAKRMRATGRKNKTSTNKGKAHARLVLVHVPSRHRHYHCSFFSFQSFPASRVVPYSSLGNRLFPCVAF